MKPLVSILIPAYNAEGWLAATIRSAIAQTWEPKEIIVVDDGSTDGTLAVARMFESQGVRVCSQPNRGASAARNKAFSLSHGGYIQWLDADDLLAPDKIAKQLASVSDSTSPKVLISGEWGSFMYRPSHAKFIPSGLWQDLQKTEWLLRKMEHNVYMQTAVWLVSRELAEAAGPWNTEMICDDDGEYFCRVLLASERIQFVPGSKVYYRKLGPNSLSYIGNSNRKRDAQWLSMQLHIGYLRSLDDGKRARAACVNFLQNWMVHFYPERLDLFEKARELARSLDGDLKAPTLSWKYVWIKNLLGWRLARRAQFFVPSLKLLLLTRIDKIIYRFQIRSQVADT